MQINARRAVAAAVAVSALSVAVPAAEAAKPAPQGPTAAITYLGNELEPFGSYEKLYFPQNETCKGAFSHRAPSIAHLMWTKHNKDLTVPAGAPLRVLTVSYFWTGGAHAVCINLASFTPAEGARYTVRQAANATQCETVLTDDTTGQPPADLQQLDTPRACLPKGY